MVQLVVNRQVKYYDIGPATEYALRALRNATVDWRTHISLPLQAALTALLVFCSCLAPTKKQLSPRLGRLREPRAEDLKAANYLIELSQGLDSGCYTPGNESINIIVTDHNSPIIPNSCTVVWYTESGMSISNMKPLDLNDLSNGIEFVGLKVAQNNLDSSRPAGAPGSWVVEKAGNILDPEALQRALFELSNPA